MQSHRCKEKRKIAIADRSNEPSQKLGSFYLNIIIKKDLMLCYNPLTGA
jgi:hypothetical protein